MSHLGYDFNEYGTMISKHKCPACEREFSICPASDSKDLTCGLPPRYDLEGKGCPSYRKESDIDALWDGLDIHMEPIKNQEEN